ncbi:hypothetical protein [Microbacterium sp. NPDC055683]
MQATNVGEGDATIKVNAPTYRVEFWERPGPGFGWNLDAWELEDCASADEAAAWAREHARGRLFTLYVALRDHEASESIHVRLLGSDPNEV